MGIDIFSKGSSSIDQLIETTLQLEAQPRFRLEDKKSSYEARSKILSELDSKLSALNKVSKRLTDVLTDYFAAKSSSSSDDTRFTATSESEAAVGTHDINISRIASSDTRVSQQYSKSGTDLTTFFSTYGSQTFNIEVGHPTDDDSSNRETIAVTVDSSGTTNDDVLKDIALAINNAMSTAVTAETIDVDEKVAASVVHEEDGTSRLIFKSGSSGYTYRMNMTDSGDSLLSSLGINDAVLAAGTAGGYVTSIGTSASDSELNAQLTVDGLTFYRDSNTIDDILDGVTMTIKNVTETTETLKVETDTETVKDELQSLLDSYNGVITYLREKQKVDPETKKRGELAGESTYSFLRSGLRNIMSSQITSVSSGNPKYLFEIGITAGADGTLSLSDNEKFESALSTGSGKVSDLFNSSNGVAEQIKDFLESFVKVGGILDDSKDGIEDRVKSIDNQLNRFDDRLARREAQLRKQFSKMQETVQLLGGQQSAFANLAATIRF